MGSGGAGRIQAIVGKYGRGQARLSYSQVLTPMGWVSELSLARAISESGCAALERVRHGGGLASLVDQRGGWHAHKTKALEYALSVLTLAAKLGDVKADNHLAQIQ